MTHPRRLVAIVLLAMAAVATPSGCGRGPADSLIRAIEADDEAAYEALLRDAGLDVNAGGRGGVTPLLQALRSGNKPLYKKLLARGADPNICDQRGSCAMNEAADAKDPYWLREALKNGGDPNALNTGNRHAPGSTPIFYAISVGEFRLDSSHAVNTRMLIAAGADVNHQDIYGETPLMTAAESGNYEVVVMLLEAGADPEKPNIHGRTVVDWFDGRDESLVPFKDQLPWFRNARQMLIKRGSLDASPTTP